MLLRNFTEKLKSYQLKPMKFFGYSLITHLSKITIIYQNYNNFEDTKCMGKEINKK